MILKRKISTLGEQNQQAEKETNLLPFQKEGLHNWKYSSVVDGDHQVVLISAAGDSGYLVFEKLQNIFSLVASLLAQF